MITLYPLKLSAVTKSPIWGGTRLPREWGKRADTATVGESWELTVRRLENSIVLNGPLAGRALADVLREAGLLSGEFPLLIKLIDAADALSVQVHPDDAYAARVERDRGKTELWYIVEADEGAEIVCGLCDGATRADFAAAVRENDPQRVLKARKVRAGEAYFIPAGLPHAIGRGILIAEIQQNCDLTYRVYDYGRLGPDGAPRALHIDKALDVVRPFTDKEIAALRFSRASEDLAGGEVLADCAYFRVERLQTSGAYTLPACEKWRHLLCLAGSAALVWNGASYPIEKGDSYFLPPLPALTIKGALTALISAV